MADALTLKDLRGGREVLHGVSLDLPLGQIVAHLGANGAGKSSRVMAAAGRLDEVKGEVTLAGPQVGRPAAAPDWQWWPRGTTCCPARPCRKTSPPQP